MLKKQKTRIIAQCTVSIVKKKTWKKECPRAKFSQRGGSTAMPTPERISLKGTKKSLAKMGQKLIKLRMPKMRPAEYVTPSILQVKHALPV